MKRKRKSLKKEFIIMGGFLAVLLFLQLFLQTGWGDDVWFAQDTRTLGNYLSDRYRDWTSRLLIEAGVKLLTATPDWIWRILNILIVLLLVWIVADLFGIERDNTKLQSQVFFFALMWWVPMQCIREAGWIATTLNYLWPLTLGLVAMRPIKHWVKGERCLVWEYVFCPLCMIFATNTEQGAAVLLGTYLLFGVYLLKERRKLSPFYFVLLFLVVASIVFILTTPGNANRMMQEMERFFPEYESLNMPQKLLMGFVDTGNYYFAAGGSERTNYLFALLTSILIAGIWRKRKEESFLPKALVAFFPFLFFWGIGCLGNYCLRNKDSGYGWDIIGLFGLNRCLPTGAGVFGYFRWISYSWWMVLLQVGVYFALLICVVLTIYFLHGRSCETLFELVILGAGLLSRLMIVFSPTFYASGERTALYCSVAVLIVCLRNLQFCWNRHGKK